MIKNSIAFVVLFVFVFIDIFWGFSYALSPKQKGLILEGHKKQQLDLLFESDSFFLDEEDRSIFDVSRKVGVYTTIKDKISDKKNQLEQKQQTLTERIDSLKKVIEDLDDDLSITTSKVSHINSQVIEVKEQVEFSNKTIELLRKKIDNSRKVLLEYYVYLYKKKNLAYGGDGIDNIKSIILSGEDVGEMIDDLYLKGLIQVVGKQLIDRHRAYVKELYLKKTEAQKQEKELKKLRKNFVIERKVLQDKRSFKERIMEVTKGKEALYKQYIESKIKQEKNFVKRGLQEKIKFENIKNSLLKKYNCEFVDFSKVDIDTLSLSDRCVDLNKMIYSESKLKNIESRNNFFAWPVAPLYGISSYFKDDEYMEDFGTDHDAIDIIVPQGTTVRAPADGYVIHVQKPVDSDYAFIAIKHGAGLVSVYGHISEALVENLDFVQSGDAIAKSGGEYGTNGAGIMTTGPHLHFEVFNNKQWADPLNYLDISYLPFSDLPSKYENKFKQDFQKRKGYEYKMKEKKSQVFSLQGETEIERQKSLLNTYAIPVFRDWSMWIEESLDGNVDPSFVMCIGLAETTLGNYLKTPYNVGNVGNTDSGATRNYPNARSGIYMIVHTLNNKFFKHINSIAYLSGAGRKKIGAPGCGSEAGSHCYATDTNHWHKNIVKCMSTIKGEYISDNYNFRLLQDD